MQQVSCEEASSSLKVLLAPDSFKGTLSSPDVARILTEELRRSFPSVQVRQLLVGDGGEGTLQAIRKACPSEEGVCAVSDPLGRTTSASFLLLPNRDAFIETAQANGLTLISLELRDPTQTSTFGVGELIVAALDAGARSITLGVGGSSTNDAGMGCLRALGVVFRDAQGKELAGNGADLAVVQEIDTSQLDPRLSEASIRVMCDVINPLCGQDGATRVYAAQKGATSAQLAELEQGMLNFARVSAEHTGVDRSCEPGVGAAGGLAFGLRTFLGAELVPGADYLLDLVGFNELCSWADVCITGEGRLDEQTAQGKLVSVVARRCALMDTPCYAVVGSAAREACGLSIEGLRGYVACMQESKEVHALPSPVQAQDSLRLAARKLFEQIA